MNKIILATLAALSLVSTVQAQAQTPAPGLFGVSGLSANAGAVSDYRFRGISQTFGKPAAQFGVDYAHSSGLYVGNWNSNINEGAGYPSSHWETDFYGGYKTTLGNIGLDVGAIYYGYPSSSSSCTRYQISNPKTGERYSGTVKNTEVYIGASWQWLSAKYFYSTDAYFSMPGSRGTTYLDISATFDLGDGWGINGHVGQLTTKGINSATINTNYNDFKFGVTKDINGWVFGAAAVWTTAKADNCTSANYAAGTSGPYCYSNTLAPNQTRYEVIDSGKSSYVLSVNRTF